jgi:16S rRNA (cytidine1402-2'-O)-methyltransferase
MGGASIAFVSDAGTPSVSDPGFRLVSTLIAKGLDVVPIPGVSAAVAALSVSGLPTDSFVFVGFLSRKKGKRLEQISGLVQEKRTIIFYESPKRVVNFIEEVMGVFGDRNGMLAREMTKIHEEFIRGSLTDILAVLRGKESVKGECTVIVAGADDPGPPDGSIESEIRERLLKGDEGPSILAKDISVKYGVRKNDVYAEILRIRSGQDPKTPSD